MLGRERRMDNLAMSETGIRPHRRETGIRVKPAAPDPPSALAAT